MITSGAAANYFPHGKICNSLTAFQDTIPQRPIDTIPAAVADSSILSDSSLLNDDTTIIKTDTFGLKLSKDSLEAPVNYSASDSIVLKVPQKQIILYNKGNMKYQDMDLKADSIGIDQTTRMVVATYRKDTAGVVQGRPHMEQAETVMDADVIKYDFETQKGLTQNTFTQQGEIYFQGERFKKISENEYFGYRGQFTTCNLDTPHFAFRTKKLKLITQKMAISGPIHPEFEGVPIPIYLPFGFFPISQGRHSGLLAPTFTSSDQFGLGLTGLGYYKVLSDYFDVLVRSDIYSYGGWALYLTPTYRKRYRYNGSLNFTLLHTRLLSSSAKQEFTTARTFNITWSHSVDSRARPGTSFSANVNAGSTKYNQYVTNNPTANFTNQLNSSVTYSKTWDNYNLTLSANHQQNNNTGIVSLNLPNAAFTVNTFYPFQKKDFVGNAKWYEKLGIGLNSSLGNQISFYDSLFSFRRVLDTMQWGAQHRIPIQLSLPALGPLQVSPGISYQEKWYSRQMIRTWNEAEGKLDTAINKGFYTARDVSFSLGLSTAIFGMFDHFGKNSSIRAIRHVIRPTFSLSYKPDLSGKDYYDAKIGETSTGEDRTYRFSKYDGSLYGAFSEGTFGGISFGIDNNLEAKIRSKKDTTDGGIKKVRLIDGFGFNGSYNLMADSFNLSTFSLYMRSTLFDKINITASAVLDPYQVDSFGLKKDRYMWQDGGGFKPGRITSGNIAISTSFQSKRTDGKESAEQKVEDQNLPPVTMEEQMAELQYIQQNPSEFADFNVPWSLNMSYSLNFSRQFKSDYSGFETIVNSNFNWNGDFNLTPKWKMGVSGYYDFKTSSIQSLTTYITREMHCWQLSINVTPVGLYRSFNITINPKSGMLRDLKINRSRFFYGN